MIGWFLLGLFVGWLLGYITCALLSHASTSSRLDLLERQVTRLNRATPAVALITAEEHERG